VDYGFRESIHRKAPTSKFHYLYLISDILVILNVLLYAQPTVSTHRSAYSAGANTSGIQNEFAVPVMASNRGTLPVIQSQSTKSFWESGSSAYRPIVCGSAKRYARRWSRPGWCPNAAYPLLVSE